MYNSVCIQITIYICINSSLKIKPLPFFRLIMAFAGILTEADITAALQACQGNLHVSGPSH